MAKVHIRSRGERGALYFDFFFRSIRCREQTTLKDTPDNRKRLQALANRIEKEMARGTFDYATHFPNSTRVAQFTEASNPATTASAVNQEIATPEPRNSTPRFSEFSVLWRSEMAPQWRRLHRGSVDAIFNAHLLPTFGEMPIAAIGKADILAFRARLATLPGRGNKHLTSASINKIVGILRQCLTEACERHHLPDVLKGIKRLKSRRPDVQPFSMDEVERIRSAIRVDYQDYVTVRFFTGMRTGEINGLKWKYVDFENALILVRETFSDGEAEESAKTEMSIRDIPMVPMVMDALKRQFDNRNPECPYVFASREGNPVDAHNFANRVWYPLLRYLDIDRRRPYQTRHTTATLMLAAGENPEWIARLMGHSNTQMLFTVYSRFVPNLTRQDGQAFNGLLNRAAAKATTPANDHEAALARLSSLPPEALKQLLALAESRR